MSLNEKSLHVVKRMLRLGYRDLLEFLESEDRQKNKGVAPIWQTENLTF